jgi:hypothetical protein
MLNNHNWDEIQRQFLSAGPFNHVVIDNFWQDDFAKQLAGEFPAYDDPTWHGHYHNAIEDKKICNRWDSFPSATYQAFSYLTNEFNAIMKFMIRDENLRPDQGLHGGGWHAHTKGGKNNIHLDYSIHPKLKLQRKLNIIIYMTPEWKPEWNGGLELWDHNHLTNGPNQCVKTVDNKFNRAIIFDTTQNSWHGLPVELACPVGTVRQSLAVYYVTKPEENADPRGKALFAPYKEQAQDPEVLDLIKKRSNVDQAAGVYKK